METLTTLIETMKTMVDAHTRLLDLGKEKQKILVEGNIERLQSLNHLESACVEEVQHLEQQRKQIMNDYLVRNGFSGLSFTLEDLIRIQDNQFIKNTLSILARKLRTLIQEITHLNESNQQLIQTSLSYVQYSMGMLVRKEPAIGYGPNTGKRYSSLLDAKI